MNSFMAASIVWIWFHCLISKDGFWKPDYETESGFVAIKHKLTLNVLPNEKSMCYPLNNTCDFSVGNTLIVKVSPCVPTWQYLKGFIFPLQLDKMEKFIR